MEGVCPIEHPTYLTNSCQGGSTVALFMTLVDLVIRIRFRSSKSCFQFRSKPQDSRTEYYDFIVVGGGVAGPVVASRLSEGGQWKVALLEAGPDEPTTTQVPAFWSSAVGSDLDWKFETQPEQNACLSTRGVCKWPRGKMLGGTGSMSGTMYSRGHRSIFDSWASQGNPGWSYNDVLDYFKKSENNLNPDIVEKSYHGFRGPMTVQKFTYAPPIAQDILQAGEEIGLNVHDLNGINQTGIAIAQIMVHNGLRASTPRMYLRSEAFHNANLFVKLNATVTKVLIETVDNNSKRAKGVEFYQNERKHTIYATKEVILTAGAIGSPHLLLLSGVGPKEDLEKHNIDVVQDLKVGHNLHNHVGTFVSFTVNDPNYEPSLTASNLNKYIASQTGPVACNGITQVTSFIQTSYSSEAPDIQFFFDGYSSKCPELKSENNTRIPILIRPTNLIPLSRGYLTLRSNDPFDPPMIYANYLTEKQDAQVLVEGIKWALRLSRTEALQKWDIQLDETPIEDCASHTFGTDDYWYCLVHSYTGPENHQAGSCKMGPRPENGDIVDPELKVHGISNLRVMDASVFPQVPNANPIPGIIMVAEKGADMVRSSWP